jgi:hypothetical protein
MMHSPIGELVNLKLTLSCKVRGAPFRPDHVTRKRYGWSVCVACKRARKQRRRRSHAVKGLKPNDRNR